MNDRRGARQGAWHAGSMCRAAYMFRAGRTAGGSCARGVRMAHPMALGCLGATQLPRPACGRGHREADLSTWGSRNASALGGERTSKGSETTRYMGFAAAHQVHCAISARPVHRTRRDRPQPVHPSAATSCPTRPRAAPRAGALWQPPAGLRLHRSDSAAHWDPRGSQMQATCAHGLAASAAAQQAHARAPQGGTGAWLAAAAACCAVRVACRVDRVQCQAGQQRHRRAHTSHERSVF